MRIGNTDELNQTNRSDGLISLLQPENQNPLTKAQRFKNWWHYRKWYVVVGVFLLVTVFRLIGGALGLFDKAPDLQIAYVGRAALPQDTADALQQAFAALAGDYNGDGEVVVQVNQYIRDRQSADVDRLSYQYASDITLIGDISECESYLFLLDDPQDFQQEHQLLAAPDGSCPAQADYSTAGKVIRWADCPLLADAALGGYTEIAAGQEVNGDSQELLKDLYLGRRCFYTDKTTAHPDECGALWDMLYEAAGN